MPLRILVVDDDSINRLIARRLLTELGGEVSEAVDGIEALAQVEQSAPFALILMDKFMPRMDGIEATRTIRALPDIPQPYIVAITGETEPGRLEPWYQVGLNDFLPKPFDRHSLAAMLARYKNAN